MPGPATEACRRVRRGRARASKREDLFFSFVFDAEATIKLPDYAVRYYADGFSSSRAALRGSFGFYRAWDATTTQNQNRRATKLTMPVLAIGGETTSSVNPPSS